MSLFIDTITDEVGTYEYGHCFADNDEGEEIGCGMEYAYVPDLNRLDHWHDAVGQVTTVTGFTDADRDALEREHAAHMMWPHESVAGAGPLRPTGFKED